MNPGATARLEEMVRVALQSLSRFLEKSRQRQHEVVNLKPVAQWAQRLHLKEWLAGGEMDTDHLATFLNSYLDGCTRLHHPGYMAHQVAVPVPPTAVADLINGMTNNGMAIYEMGPTAVAVELSVLDWFLSKVGWGPSRWPGEEPDPGIRGGGVLTHGGSLANLTALLAARAAVAPAAWESGNPGDLAVLASPAAHYSVARSLSMMGLGRRALYPLPMDAEERIRPEALADVKRQVKADGRRIMAVVASACATATGLYDPLEAIGRWCQAEGIWLHVDAAHGAAALLSTRERIRMQGVERADSLIWDAHKMLRTSALCTAVLVKDGRRLTSAFQEQASYLFYDQPSQGVDLIHRTVECTKAPLGLKLFLNLAILGEKGLADYVEATFATARRFHALISERPGFECPIRPESNILCFRHGHDDAKQILIRDSLLMEGRFHISSALFGGNRYLRLCLMNPATDETTLEALLNAIERLKV